MATKTVNFGSTKAGLTTVGYRLLDVLGVAGTRITAGVYEIGGGSYGASIAATSGSILWDTGETPTPLYASESLGCDSGMEGGVEVPTTRRLEFWLKTGSPAVPTDPDGQVVWFRNIKVKTTGATFQADTQASRLVRTIDGVATPVYYIDVEESGWPLELDAEYAVNGIPKTTHRVSSPVVEEEEEEELTLEEAIEENAKGPKRASGDQGMFEQHPLADQLELLKYQRSATTAGGGWGALRTTKFIPPGAD